MHISVCVDRNMHFYACTQVPDLHLHSHMQSVHVHAGNLYPEPGLAQGTGNAWLPLWQRQRDWHDVSE